MPWSPVVDGAFAREPLVPMSFHEAVAAGRAADIPVIMGCCRDEGLILTPKFFQVSAIAVVRHMRGFTVALLPEFVLPYFRPSLRFALLDDGDWKVGAGMIVRILTALVSWSLCR